MAQPSGPNCAAVAVNGTWLCHIAALRRNGSAGDGYLATLVGTGTLRMSLRYGSTGRPEQEYSAAVSQASNSNQQGQDSKQPQNIRIQP